MHLRCRVVPRASSQVQDMSAFEAVYAMYTQLSKNQLPGDSMSAKARKNITFELSDEEFDALVEDATRRQSPSRHQRARDIILDHLSNQSTADLSEAVERLDAELACVQDMIRRLTFCVIVHAAGKPSSVANEWIREHMSSNPSART